MEKSIDIEGAHLLKFRANNFSLNLGFAEEGRFVDVGSVRKEKGASQDIDLEGV